MTIQDKDTIATQILHDINVLLEEDYAEPDRELFPFLQPYFSYEHRLPFQVRFFEALNTVSDVQRLAVKRGVEEALRRCGAQWRGLWRGLEVFDLHQKLTPDALSTDLQVQLLCVQPNARPEQRAIWIDLLLRRWKKAGINPVINLEIWRGIVQDVNVDALIDTLTYLVEGPLRLKPGVLDCLNDAEERLDLLTRAGALTPEQIVELPAALQDLHRAIIPSFRLHSSRSRPKFSSIDFQIVAEANALLTLLHSEGYSQDAELADEDAELACQVESELDYEMA